jgi:hypothetical protein
MKLKNASLRRFFITSPDQLMDLFVKDRWDSKENGAENSTTDRMYFDRNGTLKLNTNNIEVRQAFAKNVEMLSKK